MEILQQWCKMRLSFRNATIFVCFFNLITVILLLQGFLSASSNRKFTTNNPNSVQLRYIKESEEIRRAMEPLELMRRVREIEHEAYIKPKSVEQKEAKQAAAVDLISRLSNFRSYSDSGNLKGNYLITLSHSSSKDFESYINVYISSGNTCWSFLTCMSFSESFNIIAIVSVLLLSVCEN